MPTRRADSPARSSLDAVRRSLTVLAWASATIAVALTAAGLGAYVEISSPSSIRLAPFGGVIVAGAMLAITMTYALTRRVQAEMAAPLWRLEDAGNDRRHG